jgi:hypothetical protein
MTTTKRGWWILQTTGVEGLTEIDLKHIGKLVAEGYTSGEIIQESDGVSHWDEIPGYPVEDWRYEVMNDDTRLGYSEWVENQREWERFENENQLKEESK